MPGRVINEAFNDGTEQGRIPSWEKVAGDCGMHAPAAQDEDTAAAIAELRDLGYADADTNAVVNGLEREREYNRALVHFSCRRFEKARAVLTRLNEERSEPHVALMLAYACYRAGDLDTAVAALCEVPRENALAANAKLLESYVALARENPKKAAADVTVAERIGFDRPLLLLVAASMYMRLGQLSQAEETLRTVLELDPSSDNAHALLARVQIARGKSKEAVATAATGLSVEYGSASLHSAIGVALADNDPDGALQAFETALLFDPQFTEAAAWSEAVRERRH
jgi:tetratricopeptide (TPR) repeat protein